MHGENGKTVLFGELLMEINHLKEFIVVADTRNLSDSAKRLFMSESALSKHMSLMEGQLETKLLLRGKRGVSLTEAGEVFYEDAKRIVSEYDRALFRLSSIEKRNVVRVGYLRNASASFLPAFMKYVDETHPEVYPMFTAMEYGQIEEAIATKHIDMAFTLSLQGARSESERMLPLYRDRLYLVAASTNPLATGIPAGGSIDTAALADAQVLMPDKRTYPGDTYRFYESLLPGDFRGKIRRYRDIDTLLAVVSNGRYVGFSSGHNAPFAAKGVRFIPITDKDTDYDVCAIYNENPASAAVPLYLEALQALKESGVIRPPRMEIANQAGLPRQ